jgi:hypothetical protein
VVSFSLIEIDEPDTIVLLFVIIENRLNLCRSNDDDDDRYRSKYLYHDNGCCRRRRRIFTKLRINISYINLLVSEILSRSGFPMVGIKSRHSLCIHRRYEYNTKIVDNIDGDGTVDVDVDVDVVEYCCIEDESNVYRIPERKCAKFGDITLVVGGDDDPCCWCCPLDDDDDDVDTQHDSNSPNRIMGKIVSIV